MSTDTQEGKPSYLKDAITALVVTAILAAALAVSSIVLQPKSNKSVYGLRDASMSGISAEPDDSIDMLFIGDSLVLNACLPLEMWHDYGYASFDLTTLAQKLPDTKTMLQLGTKSQHPKVIVFEVEPIFAKCTFDHALMNEVERVFPVLRYHSYWRLFRLSELTTPPAVERSVSRGALRTHRSQSVDPEILKAYMAPSDEVAEINSFSSWYFARMLDYCRSKGATPVLVSIPCPNSWDMARHNAVTAWAAEQGVDYYDLNLKCDEIGIDWKFDSKDGGEHLNVRGAKKLSRYLGKLLDEQYDLPDHRGDEAYALWNEDYESLYVDSDQNVH